MSEAFGFENECPRIYTRTKNACPIFKNRIRPAGSNPGFGCPKICCNQITGKEWGDALLTCFQKWKHHFISEYQFKDKNRALSSESLPWDIQVNLECIACLHGSAQSGFHLDPRHELMDLVAFLWSFPQDTCPHCSLCQFVLCSFFQRQHGSWNCTSCPSWGRNSEGWMVLWWRH